MATVAGVAKERVGVAGTVYLICFDQPFGHARHYCGWAAALEARIAHHRAGTGANLLKHVNAAGITWRVVRTWSADRYFERRVKNGGGLARVCPRCNPKPRHSETATDWPLS